MKASRNFAWTASDDLEIKGFEWEVEQPKAILCLVHGMGEHAQRYEELAGFFNQNDISVISFDHRGHGTSAGPRGHVRDYDILLESVDTLLEKAKEKYPDTPLFVYGHSMGGNVAVNHALRRQQGKEKTAHGYIITGPWLQLEIAPPAVKLLIGKLMRRIYPRFIEKTKLDASLLSHVPEVVEAYKADPLVHDSLSTSFFFSCQDAAEWALNNAEKLEIPMLLMHGELDKITSAKGSETFAERAGELVTLKLWEGLYHEIHNENERQDVYQFSLDWINEQLNGRG